jgi:hypothetical protein
MDAMQKLAILLVTAVIFAADEPTKPPKPLDDKDARTIQAVMLDLSREQNIQLQLQREYTASQQREVAAKASIEKLKAEYIKKYEAQKDWELNDKAEWVKIPGAK